MTSLRRSLSRVPAAVLAVLCLMLAAAAPAPAIPGNGSADAPPAGSSWSQYQPPTFPGPSASQSQFQPPTFPGPSASQSDSQSSGAAGTTAPRDEIAPAGGGSDGTDPAPVIVLIAASAIGIAGLTATARIKLRRRHAESTA